MKFNVRSVPRFIGLAVTVLATTHCSILPTKTATEKANAIPQSKVELSLTETDDISSSLDIDTGMTHEYKCELNDSFTFYINQDDDKRAKLRWKKNLYELQRVDTTTGANRFENKKAGLVWISIPTKAMLFDSINGKQLANECKTVNQIN